jgi:hypothetical protein
MKRSSQLARYVGLLALVLLVGLPAGAVGATPAEKCAGGKAKAVGAAILAQASCQAKARKKSAAVDAGCLQQAEKKLRKRFTKAEKAGGCPGDATEALAGATACVATIDAATAGDAACAARKLKAAGKLAAGASGCAKKAAVKGIAIEGCLSKVAQRYAKAMAKADRKGSCTGTTAEIEAAVEACGVAEPPPTACTGGAGFATCDGSCPAGLTCRPYEVFENGAPAETGCSCVDLAGPACDGTVCGVDQHCPDPTEVCERWLTGDPLGCDHVICQPALTTPTTLPPREMLECDGGEFPTCGGTCPPGERCQAAQATLEGFHVFAGCICVDPRGPRCEPANCDLEILPHSHCADPTKVCLVTVAGGDDAICVDAHCGDPQPIVFPPTSTTSTSNTSSSTTSSTSTTSTTSTSTTTTTLCTSTPGVSGCFTDLGDCTILDTCTGLQWEQKTTAPGLHDVTDRFAWSGCCDHDCTTVENHCQPNAAAAAACLALADNGTEGCDLCAGGRTCGYINDVRTTVWDWIAQLNADEFAGHGDWRLARENGLSFIGGERELGSILLMSFPCDTSPCIDPIFGPTIPSIYWTATTKGPNGPTRPSDAWFVGFGDGGWGDAGKWGPLYVRAVRTAE